MAQIIQDQQNIIDAVNGNGGGGGGQVTFPDGYFDAFGRLRTAEVTTLIDLKQTNDNLPLYFDEETIGGGASVHSTTEARSRMTVSSNNDAVIRQTKMRFNYQSGKSQLIEMTCTNFQAETNVTKRIGYFTSTFTTPFNSSLDGLFFEASSGDISVNVAKSGTVTSVTQANWNLDTLDGNGSSGINVDWSKGQILIIDFQWLGVGRVRWALDIDGKIVYFHETLNANNVSGVYISSPNKPVRYEIRSTGGTGTLDHICASVNVEGVSNNLGTIRSYNFGNDDYRAQSVNNKYALFAFRQKTGCEDAVIDLIKLNLLVTTGDSFLWEYHINPTVTLPAFTGVTDGCLEFARFNDNTQVTSDGTVLDSGYVYQKSDARKDVLNAIKLGAAVDGTRDVGVITVTPVSNGLDVFAGISYREII